MLNTESLPLYPKDPIFSLQEEFLADSREDKQNLGLGVYLEEDGKPRLLDVVKEAEQHLNNQPIPRGYLPILGDLNYRKNVKNWVQSFAPQYDISNSIVVQTTGCTEALFLSGYFLEALGVKSIHVSDHTWLNHHSIFSEMLSIDTYPYYDRSAGSLRFDALIGHLNEKKPETVLFHGSCHNPSGVDLAKQEWKIIAQICQQQQIIPVFDAAYLGLGSSMEQDFEFLSPFIESGMPFFLNLSFSKNLTIYGERLGAFILFNTDPKDQDKIERALSKRVRSIHSTPPRHGSDLFNTIASSSDLSALWQKELGQMRDRLDVIRRMMAQSVQALSSIHMEDKKGFFLLLPLSEEQVIGLRQEHGIYMPKSGRVNISALCPKTIKRFTDVLNLAMV